MDWTWISTSIVSPEEEIANEAIALQTSQDMLCPMKKTKSIDGYESETKIYKRITLRNTQAKNLQQEKKGDIS